MKLLAKRLSPSATDLLRADHSRVVAAFHRYSPDLPPRVKLGLVDGICLALEVHARIEEEIFYPAMRNAAPAIVDESLLQHQEMKTLIGALRGMDAEGPEYDETLFRLMRAVMHHVADEETRLFPDAERMFPEEIAEHGARMAKRRLQLGVPRARELARNAARLVPLSGVLATAAGVLAGALLYRQAMRR
jgi:hemerythrin superfamily protein